MIDRLVLVSLAAIVPAACGQDSTVEADAAPPPIDAMTAPVLAISVTPDRVTAGESLTLAVELEGFELVNPTTVEGPEPGKGHFHVYFDGASEYAAAWFPSVSITTTAADPVGEHTLRVVLVNSDHAELVPTVADEATFTIDPPDSPGS